MIPIIKTYAWQCMECKSCAKCKDQRHEVSPARNAVYERFQKLEVSQFNACTRVWHDCGCLQDKMLFCDHCDRGFHTFCVGLEAIPNGRWECPSCRPRPIPHVTPPSTPMTPAASGSAQPAENPSFSYSQEMNEVKDALAGFVFIPFTRPLLHIDPILFYW